MLTKTEIISLQQKIKNDNNINKIEIKSSSRPNYITTRTTEMKMDLLLKKEIQFVLNNNNKEKEIKDKLMFEESKQKQAELEGNLIECGCCCGKIIVVVTVIIIILIIFFLFLL